MKLNENDALLTSKVLLVPYCERHVPTYHEWMKDADLQKATASEPLTLEEEYSMQKSWRLDSDKLTFIVCNTPSAAASEQDPKAKTFKSTPGKDDAPEAMIGDVNLFLFADDEEDPEDVDWRLTDARIKDIILDKKLQSVVGEIEIMIARNDHQGKGYGREVLLAFIWYIMKCFTSILEEYHTSNGNGKPGSYLKYLRVKIDKDNARSIRLFESAGFKKVTDEPNYFGELELRWPVSAGSLENVEERMSQVPLKVVYKA